MDYYIRTDIDKMRATASEIEKYVSEARALLDDANDQVFHRLPIAWQGADLNMFEAKWKVINDSASANEKMLYALESYSRYLLFAAEVYETAQRKAALSAGMLPS